MTEKKLRSGTYNEDNHCGNFPMAQIIYPPTVHALRYKGNNGAQNGRIEVGQEVFAKLLHVSITINKPVKPVCDRHNCLQRLQKEDKVNCNEHLSDLTIN